MKTKYSMVAAAVLNLFLMSSVIGASFTIEVPNSVQYLNPQLSFRNMIKFKMAVMNWIVENLIIDPCV